MKIKLNNCFVNIKDESEYIEQIYKSLNQKKNKTFFYLNSYSFYLVNKNQQFKDVFNKSDFVIADGYSIIWLIKHLYKININKVVFTYSFFNKLYRIFSNNNSNIYLLGSTQSKIEKSVKLLKSSKYNLNIVGSTDGFFDVQNENENIINDINNSQTEVLICGMGMPKTEIWVQNNLHKLNLDCVFSVGGFFDILLKNKNIAPKWLYNSGLEWIYRLIQEPKRLFWRYIKVNTYFIFYILKSVISNVFK
ncbi:MAG: WecB/TagA/CpsF family glycosyltransferase [Bacteroidetes bacterium]|nr:WecB/TagA/CpsF family glycosyltransferase [Bacteroidota bacterium]